MRFNPETGFLMSDQLYREAILDHYKHQRHKGKLENPDSHYHDHNPFCGDDLTIDLKVEDGIQASQAMVSGTGSSGRGSAMPWGHTGRLV